MIYIIYIYMLYEVYGKCGRTTPSNPTSNYEMQRICTTIFFASNAQGCRTQTDNVD